MIAIVYLSESNKEFTENDLKSLALLSANRNKQAGITGYLIYQHGKFLQYIEGEESAVLVLMKSIEKDNRHQVKYQLKKDIEKKRFFPSWNMKFIEKEELDEIQLETLIEENFILIKKEFPNKKLYEKFLWNHVKLISRIIET